LILASDLLLRIPRNLAKYSQQKDWSDLLTALATDLVLVLDSAIEYPLFFAFHPVTLSSSSSSIAIFPTITQLAFQILILYFIEYTFCHLALRRISFPPGDTAPTATSDSEKPLPEENNTDEAARLAMDFLRPRGALLLAMASPAVSMPFTAYCGAFHPLSMVAWAASRQLFVKGDGGISTQY
jgi:hypothetical protein